MNHLFKETLYKLELALLGPSDPNIRNNRIKKVKTGCLTWIYESLIH